MMRFQIESKQQGVFSFASFSLGLPSGIGKATNSVGFHWASKENEEMKSKQINRMTLLKIRLMSAYSWSQPLAVNKKNFIGPDSQRIKETSPLRSR
jgi:hypothetical protein